MSWRVYIEVDGDREYLGSFPTQDEAEIVAEHSAEEEGEYVYVVNPDNNIVFRMNEPDEGLLYDEW